MLLIKMLFHSKQGGKLEIYEHILSKTKRQERIIAKE